MNDDDWKLGGSVRAKARLKQIHKTQRYLVEALGVTSSAVSQFLTGKRTPNSNQLKAMAKQLNCSGHWLLTGDGPIVPQYTNNDNQPEERPVPLLDIEEVADIDIKSLSKIAGEKNIKHVLTKKDIGNSCGPNTFALIVKDTSMSPAYQVGDHVYVDPNTEYRTGDIVLATIKGQSSAIIRVFSEDGENIEGNESFTLTALGKEWPSNSNCKPSKSNRIIGKVIDSARDIRGSFGPFNV
jgi:SOS-response transcriptional repressor LexA